MEDCGNPLIILLRLYKCGAVGVYITFLSFSRSDKTDTGVRLMGTNTLDPLLLEASLENRRQVCWWLLILM